MDTFIPIGNLTVFNGVFTKTRRKNRERWISLWSIRTIWEWRWSFKARIQSLKTIWIYSLTRCGPWTFHYFLNKISYYCFLGDFRLVYPAQVLKIVFNFGTRNLYIVPKLTVQPNLVPNLTFGPEVHRLVPKLLLSNINCPLRPLEVLELR